MYTIILRKNGKTVSIKAESFSIHTDTLEPTCRFIRISAIGGLLTVDEDTIISIKKYIPHTKRKSR